MPTHGTAGNGRSNLPVVYDERPGAQETLRCPPATRGVVTWNTKADDGALALRVHFTDGNTSKALPYVSWSRARRQSLSGTDERVHIDVDVLRSSVPFDAVEVRSTAPLSGLALATYAQSTDSSSGPLDPIDLRVPMVSQFVDDSERGWCSPSSVAMVLQYHGIEADLRDVVSATYDEAFGGTGNWAFNVAFASRFGLRAYVAYLRDLAHARTLLEAGVPLVLSYSWTGDELYGAPIEHSDGHLTVLRGFLPSGDPIMNDPAHPDVRVSYPAAQLERLWKRNNGVAYVIAPQSVPTLDLVNA